MSSSEVSSPRTASQPREAATEQAAVETWPSRSWCAACPSPTRSSTTRSAWPAPAGPPDYVKRWVQYGASVRAAQYLILGGKARALMQGRYNVSLEDIRALAQPVFRHRILRTSTRSRISKTRI